MAETKNEQQPHSFKRKLGNTTYTVKVHHRGVIIGVIALDIGLFGRMCGWQIC